MDLAEIGSQDRSQYCCCKKEVSMNARTPNEKEAGAIMLTRIVMVACMNTDKSTNHRKKHVHKPDRSFAPSSECCGGNADTDDEEQRSWDLHWLCLEPDYKRMFDNERKICPNDQGNIKNTSISIFQDAANEDVDLYTEHWAQITVVVYVLCEAIVQFNSSLGISYTTQEARGQGLQIQRVAETSRCTRIESQYVYPVSLCHACGFMIHLCSVGFRWKVVWDERWEVSFVHRARKEMRQENQSLMRTATHIVGGGKPARGIQWYRDIWERLNNLEYIFGWIQGRFRSCY